MTELSTITRAPFAPTIAAPLPSDFDQRLAAYLAAKDAELAARAEGSDLWQANRDHDAASKRHNWTPRDKTPQPPEVKALFDRVISLEEATQAQATTPMYAAACAFALTPAPTPQALAIKLQVINEHCLYDDEDGIGCMELAADDARRFGLACTSFANDGSQWRLAVAEYRRLRAISDALPMDNETESDAAIDAYCVALDYLLEDVPSPTVDAFQTKLSLIAERYGMGDTVDLPRDVFEAIAADALRFAFQSGRA